MVGGGGRCEVGGRRGLAMHLDPPLSLSILYSM